MTIECFPVWQQRALHLVSEYPVRKKISDDIDLLVRDADDINALTSNQIEGDMLALWKAVIAFSHIRAVFAQLRVLG